MHILGQYTSRHENETTKFPGEGMNALKSIPWYQSQSAESYVTPTLEKFDYGCAIIPVRINDFPQRYARTEKLTEKKIMQIRTTCQS